MLTGSTLAPSLGSSLLLPAPSARLGAPKPAAVRRTRLLVLFRLVLLPRLMAAWPASGRPPLPMAAWGISDPPVGPRDCELVTGGVVAGCVPAAAVDASFFLLPRAVFLVTPARAILVLVVVVVSRDAGIFCWSGDPYVSSSSPSGVGGRRGIGVRESWTCKLQSLLAVVLLGSRLALRVFLLCFAIPLPHFRPIELQLRQGRHAVAH